MQKEPLQAKHLKEYLNFGNSLIERTRSLIIPLWEKGSFNATLKSDQTPVSEVDLQCEEMIRAAITQAYPSHGIIGEEHGSENETAELVWTIDPIDGTQNLVNRIPTFGTILGLMYHGRPMLGWIDHPILDLSLRGGVGFGTYCNGTKITLDDLPTDTLSAHDVIATNCPATFEPGAQTEVLGQILQLHPHVRMYYDVYSHSLAIQGSLAVMIEYNLKIWDICATQALIEAAGGTFLELGRTDERDKPTKFHTAFGKRKAVTLVAQMLEGTGC